LPCRRRVRAICYMPRPCLWMVSNKQARTRRGTGTGTRDRRHLSFGFTAHRGEWKWGQAGGKLALSLWAYTRHAAIVYIIYIFVWERIKGAPSSYTLLIYCVIVLFSPILLVLAKLSTDTVVDVDALSTFTYCT
jgi:hypothetical protein